MKADRLLIGDRYRRSVQLSRMNLSTLYGGYQSDIVISRV